MPVIILGVDPGSHATGYGVIETVPVVRMLAGGVIRASRQAPLADRLLVIHDRTDPGHREIRSDSHGGRGSVQRQERPQFPDPGARPRRDPAGRGRRPGLAVAEYAPREVKKALTGNGAAAKEQVRFMVMRLLGLKEEPPLDQSDALAVALAHAGRAAGSHWAETGRRRSMLVRIMSRMVPAPTVGEDDDRVSGRHPDQPAAPRPWSPSAAASAWMSSCRPSRPRSCPRPATRSGCGPTWPCARTTGPCTVLCWSRNGKCSAC